MLRKRRPGLFTIAVKLPSMIGVGKVELAFKNKPENGFLVKFLNCEISLLFQETSSY